jgi:hypothetical protein
MTSPINIGLLSPAWKSPQAPVALMNTCSTIASELMPLYFSNCLLIIDTTTQHHLREEAFKWLESVGKDSSAHFRRVTIIHRIVDRHLYEIEITIRENKEVVVTELKGGMDALSSHLVDARHKQYCLRVGVTMVENIEENLMECIKTNGTGGMGVDEFRIILDCIDHHMNWFKINFERRKRNSRPRPSYGP